MLKTINNFSTALKVNYEYLFSSERIFGTYASMLPQKKSNFPERFRADNGKNRNIPERNLSKQTIK